MLITQFEKIKYYALANALGRPMFLTFEAVLN